MNQMVKESGGNNRTKKISTRSTLLRTEGWNAALGKPEPAALPERCVPGSGIFQKVPGGMVGSHALAW